VACSLDAVLLDERFKTELGVGPTLMVCGVAAAAAPPLMLTTDEKVIRAEPGELANATWKLVSEQLGVSSSDPTVIGENEPLDSHVRSTVD
jgi:hypothetical protein